MDAFSAAFSESTGVLKRFQDMSYGAVVLWLYEWLTESARTVEQFKYVVDNNRQHLRLENSFIHLLGTVAEAMVTRCPVLEGAWEPVAVSVFYPLATRVHDLYRPTSSRLSAWIIQVVVEPDLCPSLGLRLQMLLLYTRLGTNDKQLSLESNTWHVTIESLMLICSDAHSKSCDSKGITDIIDYVSMHLVVDDLDLRIAAKLKKHREMRQKILLEDISYEYGIGLKSIPQPMELQTLTALLRYVSFDGIDISSIDILCDVVNGLELLFSSFKVSLMTPELLSITTESVMNVIVAVFKLIVESGDLEYEDSSFPCTIETLLDEICTIDTRGCDRESYIEEEGEELWNLCAIQDSPVGKEIIRRYKDEICKWRSMIPHEFWDSCDDDGSNVYDLLYYNEA
ncbi:unnamed protein product [Meganyctiphanes norvegica]|uniref:Uncharacterized protein n=1 Tax=Meganyctiphanes norvegica TaxID=48144 RepID=A0AAV2S874_MEGNR